MGITDYRDHLCYKDDFHRQHATIGGFYAAANLFNKTYVYSLYNQAHAEMKTTQALMENEGMSDMARLEALAGLSAGALIQHAEISDNFLTGGCLELIGKTILLSKGILIHKIERTSVTPLALKKLSKQQTLRPITLFEYYQAGGAFVIDNNKRKLSYVSDATIDYLIVYKDSYVASLPLSENFVVTSRKYRVMRNTTHFPPALGAEAVMELYEDGERTLTGVYDIIRDEWQRVIEPMMSEVRLKAEHNINYPFKNILDWQQKP